MQRLVRLLSVVSGVFLLLLGGFWLLGSTAPGPFEGGVGLLYALALSIVGVGLLVMRGGVWLYPFAILLPVVPILYVFAVLLGLLPPTWAVEGGDTNWGFAAVMLSPSLTAAIAMLLLMSSRRERRPSN